jgi:hypothetical protein
VFYCGLHCAVHSKTLIIIIIIIIIYKYNENRKCEYFSHVF